MVLVFLSGVFFAIMALILSDYVRSVSEAPATPLGAGNYFIECLKSGLVRVLDTQFASLRFLDTYGPKCSKLEPN